MSSCVTSAAGNAYRPDKLRKSIGTLRARPQRRTGASWHEGAWGAIRGKNCRLVPANLIAVLRQCQPRNERKRMRVHNQRIMERAVGKLPYHFKSKTRDRHTAQINNA